MCFKLGLPSPSLSPGAGAQLTLHIEKEAVGAGRAQCSSAPMQIGRVLGFLKKIAKKQNNNLSPSSKSVGQINKKSGPALPVNVDSRSPDPVEIPKSTDPDLQKNVAKESQTDPWSSPDYVGQVSEKAGAELPVNVDVRRYDSDENARSNVPGLHKNGVKKSKNETCNSAVSVAKVSRKSGALHSVTGDSRRHESRQNNGSNVYNFFLYRIPGLTRKKRKKSTYEMNMPTEPLTVTHETAGVVFPEQGDSRRHENNQDVGRPVKKTSNEKKEINPTDDSDDITQTSKIASTGCDSLYSEHENCVLLMEQLGMNYKGIGCEAKKSTTGVAFK
ncbi:uncharacterized protein LOC119243994 [Talpa occidentalis]|uniref:uncharacterized protein LOC119243994 n=1 Tax=Talpa occidentalis TaxID=50954 RepID=UPI0023F880D6|nr:uncharacterized protein LOC119243994 [Talpa occidentalis]